MPGPDHKASLEPDKLTQMIEQIRGVERAFGVAAKSPQPSEWDTRKAARQQVIAVRDIAQGARFTREDLSTARCGGGIPAVSLWERVGALASKAYRAGETIE